jgi:hypothetical protein
MRTSLHQTWKIRLKLNKKLGAKGNTNVPPKSLLIFALWPGSSAQNVGKEQFLVCIVYEDDMHYGIIDLPNCDGEREKLSRC